MLESPGINCLVRPTTPTRMREASTLATLGAVLCFCASSAQAVGFGRVSNTTQLGQPLNFSAVVRLGPDEILARECVSAEVQSGENMLQPGLVRATLEGSAESADRVVRVTTNTLIDEPVVTVSVTVGCDAKVTRKFVAFIDPPVVNLAQAPAPIAAESPSVQRNESPVAAVVDSARSLARPVPAARRAPTTTVARSRPRVRVATAPRAVTAPAIEAAAPTAAAANRSGGTLRQPAVARAAASGPRLVVESAPRMAALSASAPASGPMAAAAPASAAASSAMTPPPPALAFDEQAAQLARERERVRLLEEGLAKLRSDSQATQSSLVALQAKLKQAESQRDTGWLVSALAGLSAALAFIAAALAWRQWRARRLAEWWNPANSGAAAPQPAAVRAEPVVPEPATPRLASTKLLVARGANSPTVTSEARPTAPAPMSGAAAVVDEPPRELSVEELIDLEQQAEFFLVLGQDDAAIELLMSHVRSDGGISPLPYLKLLEIYRRLGDTAAYQRIRERFNLRFNAYAPDWDADLQHGRALVDYPDTLKRLQDLWASPAGVMETLDASLFRRNSADETFDLPAYRELLFLYSVARDLAEHGGGGVSVSEQVDLLLPMHDDDAPPKRVSVARLSAATRPGDFVHSEVMTLPVDLDVTFEPARAGGVPTIPLALGAAHDPASEPEYGFLEFDLDAEPARPKTGSTGKA